ncbi:MAG TPA: hypothetical protein P5121_12945 [Caldilineaceae bacterium]|nr:hypothetical protein [Caldilineaceae bacterium]
MHDSHRGIGSYSGWLLTNLLGGVVAGVLETKLQFLGTLILAGLPLAVAQGIYLRRRLAYPWKAVWLWSVAVAMGWPAAHLLYVRDRTWATPLINLVDMLPFGGGVVGINVVRLAFVLLIIGFAQWLVMAWLVAPQRRSAWLLYWPLLSTVAGAGLGGVQANLCRVACDPLGQWGGSLLVGATLGAVGWLFYALIVGPFLPLSQANKSAAM